MKKSFILTAIALMIGASLTAQTTNPVQDQTQSQTQTHKQTRLQIQDPSCKNYRTRNCTARNAEAGMGTKAGSSNMARKNIGVANGICIRRR